MRGGNEDETHNLFIEGENLEVLKLLQKSYAGRVKMIYIDPPYNTGNDFIYLDDCSEPLEAFLRRTGQMDEEGRRLTTNTKASDRFHSNWLNMIYPRLLLAHQLLLPERPQVMAPSPHALSSRFLATSPSRQADGAKGNVLLVLYLWLIMC